MATDNNFCDLSGVHAAASDNPYHVLIEACKGDPVSRATRESTYLTSLHALIQRRYQIHRLLRNEQQAAKLLNSSFGTWLLDPVLQKLVDPEGHPDFLDPRNCLVFWARPPKHLRTLISIIQGRLSGLNPGKRSTAGH